jgi:PAS domain S-box-containing protein
MPMRVEESPMAKSLQEGCHILAEEIIAELHNGKRIHLEVFSRPLINASGKIVGGIHVLFDITSHKQLEKQLRQNEHKLHLILEASEIGSWEWDINTNNVKWSKNLETIHGMTHGEFDGRFESFMNAVHPDDRENVQKTIQKALAGEGPYRIEHRWVRHNGEELWLEGRGRVLYDEDDNVIGMTGTCMNITERKLSEQALYEREQYLNALFQTTPECIKVVAADGTLLQMNPAGLDMIQAKDASNVIGGSVYGLIAPEHRQMFQKFNESVCRGESGTLQFDIIGHQGRRLHMETHAAPLYQSDGTLAQLAMTRDITEQKEAEAALQTINETLEERVQERTKALLSYQNQLRYLASELSKAEERERHRLATELHDHLGQLLTMCKMKLDLLQMQFKSADVASGLPELAGLMDQAIRFTRELMTDLKPPPSLDKEDFETAIQWLADKMKKHGLNVTIKDDGKPKPLSEEIRSTLLQAIRELLFNVVKHAGVDQAQVTLTRTGDWVRVTVEDNGIGFDMLNNQPSPTKHGGFGLFSIHERMDWLGGSLQIQSHSKKGTVAEMTVPTLSDKTSSGKSTYSSPTASVVTTPTAPHEQGNTIRVLLADDHKMVRTGLRKIIEEQEGLKVVAEASNGLEAVDMVRAHFPDVVVMDVNMPIMNGIDATRKITSEFQHIRVIGLSLHDNDNVAQTMRNAGASAYLTKADVYETLCATIRSEAMVSDR